MLALVGVHTVHLLYIVHQLHMTEHVMFAIERRITYSAIPLGLAKVHRPFMRQQVGSQSKRKAALVASVRSHPVVHRSNVSLQMRLGLKLESASFAWKLPHLLMHNLQHNTRTRTHTPLAPQTSTHKTPSQTNQKKKKKKKKL